MEESHFSCSVVSFTVLVNRDPCLLAQLSLPLRSSLTFEKDPKILELLHLNQRLSSNPERAFLTLAAEPWSQLLSPTTSDLAAIDEAEYFTCKIYLMLPCYHIAKLKKRKTN